MKLSGSCIYNVHVHIQCTIHIQCTCKKEKTGRTEFCLEFGAHKRLSHKIESNVENKSEVEK